MAIILGGTQDPYPEPSTAVGPLSKELNLSTMYRKATWYRQKPITSKPMKYDLDTYGNLPGNNVAGAFAGWSYTADWNSSTYTNALAKARERFNSKLGRNAALGVDFVEWQQSLNMIENRSMQLYKFAKALKRGHFGDAYEVVRGRVPRKPPKGLHKGKGFASNFLEWHFGWSPLIGDIYDAVEVLQSPISSLRVRAQAEARHSTYVRGTWDSIVHSDTATSQRYQAALGAEIYVSNPNLRLASQLGLVNPVSLAWEVVPFSFVVDWFLPVGNFLSQWSDFAGLTLRNAFTTSTWYVEHRERYAIVDRRYGTRDDKAYKYRYIMKRRDGIASYRLAATQFTGFSAMRGLTAMSLLIQQLRS